MPCLEISSEPGSIFGVDVRVSGNPVCVPPIRTLKPRYLYIIAHLTTRLHTSWHFEKQPRTHGRRLRFSDSESFIHKKRKEDHFDRLKMARVTRLAAPEPRPPSAPTPCVSLWPSPRGVWGTLSVSPSQTAGRKAGSEERGSVLPVWCTHDAIPIVRFVICG